MTEYPNTPPLVIGTTWGHLFEAIKNRYSNEEIIAAFPNCSRESVESARRYAGGNPGNIRPPLPPDEREAYFTAKKNGTLKETLPEKVADWAERLSHILARARTKLITGGGNPYTPPRDHHVLKRIIDEMNGESQ